MTSEIAGSYHPGMVPEAELKETAAGLVPASAGWFVLNARDGRWFDKPGQGHSIPLTGYDEYEAETFFPMLGLAIRVVGPGEPTTIYHWETDQEDFLVLAGEGLLIVEGEKRPVKQWDFVHCPPGTKHAFVGGAARPRLRLVPPVPERRPVGLLLRRRDRGEAQRLAARGHDGRQRRLRALRTGARDPLPRKRPSVRVTD